MAIENPLDKAADLAHNAGDGLAGLLGGTARFLEQVTGDTFTAAVFAAMLLFTLTLVKGAASSRNPRIYISSIIFVGFIIIGGTAAVSAYNASVQLPVALIEYKEALYIHKGFELAFEEAEPTGLGMFLTSFEKLKWYALIGTIMAAAGLIMLIFTKSTQLNTKEA